MLQPASPAGEAAKPESAKAEAEKDLPGQPASAHERFDETAQRGARFAHGDSTLSPPMDPVSGKRTLISGGSPVQGSGPPFVSPNALTVEADGSLLVVDGPLGFTGNSTGQRLLMRVHPVTGDRTVLSAPGKGHGPPFVAPVAVAVEADGNLLVTASGSLQAVLRVDPRTGDRSIVSLKGSEP